MNALKCVSFADNTQRIWVTPELWNTKPQHEEMAMLIE